MMAHAQPKLALRPMLPADVPLITDIFRASVAELTGDDYSAAQQEAWAAAADDAAAFGKRLADAVTLLGTIDGAPVDVDDRLAASIATEVWAMHQGAAMIRAHDVRSAVQAARVVAA